MVYLITQVFCFIDLMPDYELHCIQLFCVCVIHVPLVKDHYLYKFKSKP
uniref:Uncharacterized protein n=1 Tax=Ciona intestinalis TaxID=7719 RepID=H2XSB3_CIOIN